jgi:hypothetical protein
MFWVALLFQIGLIALLVFAWRGFGGGADDGKGS